MIWLFLAACDVEAPPEPGNTEEIVFTVPKGSTARGLADELDEAGLVTSADNWTWFLRFGADGSCLKAGKHRTNKGMSAPELLEALCGVPVPDDVAITIPEGWRIRDIDAYLVDQKLIQPGDYIAATRSSEGYSPGYALPAERTLEGYLFPETYQVSPDRFEVKAFVARQLHTFGQRFGARAVSARTPRGLDQLVIVASMVEREEPTPKNRPLVAGVIWKRLDAGWNLGIDATSRYTLPEWNDERAFLKQLFSADDPYNTRIRGGLPPGPIGNPGLSSLEAAFEPETTEYWYYLHDTSGVLHPSRNVAEHNAYKRKYLQ